MLASFLLSLREGLEAALIIGIVFGSLQHMRRTELKGVVWLGVLSAVLLSLVGAVALNLAGAEFDGRAEELFEGVAMLLAAGLLTWMIFWMRRQGASIQQELDEDVRQAVFKHGATALFLLAFLAVAREGLELALFLFAAGVDSNPIQIISGALLGLAASVSLGWLLFTSTHRLSLKNFFLVTNVLLIIFAAGLVAHAVHEFNEAGVIPGVVDHVWDINGILDEKSTVGEILKALVGYNGNPSLTEVLAYLGYFIALGLVMNSSKIFNNRFITTREMTKG
jgi:high-affinity iron transporter